MRSARAPHSNGMRGPRPATASTMCGWRVTGAQCAPTTRRRASGGRARSSIALCRQCGGWRPPMLGLQSPAVGAGSRTQTPRLQLCAVRPARKNQPAGSSSLPAAEPDVLKTLACSHPCVQSCRDVKQKAGQRRVPPQLQLPNPSCGKPLGWSARRRPPLLLLHRRQQRCCCCSWHCRLRPHRPAMPSSGPCSGARGIF